MKISTRAAAIEKSQTLAIAAKANQMAADGIGVINLSIGEPDMGTPDYISKAAKIAIEKHKTKYTATAGILPLRQAIADKLKRDNGLDYKPSQIVVSNGAKQALYNAMLAIINDGDEVIILAPYWLTYPEHVKLAGGVPVVVNSLAKNGFKVTPTQLKKAITPKTKAVIINSPNNPTGAVYTADELKALAKVIEKHEIFIISDEIYEMLNYTGEPNYSIASFSPTLYERTIVVNGLSKTYAMTGWRVGYTASSQELAATMDNIQGHTTSSVNTPAQYASLEALTNSVGADTVKAMTRTFDERRQRMLARLEKMPHISNTVPQGAFYVMVDISGLKGHIVNGKKITDSLTASEVLLESAQLATVPGVSFGAPNYVRLSYTIAISDIDEAMDRLEKFLKLIK